MDRTTLEGLKEAARQKCQQLYDQSIEVNIELERSRGDFRTYESLLLNWQDSEPIKPESVEGEVIKKESKRKRVTL